MNSYDEEAPQYTQLSIPQLDTPATTPILASIPPMLGIHKRYHLVCSCNHIFVLLAALGLEPLFHP